MGVFATDNGVNTQLMAFTMDPPFKVNYVLISGWLYAAGEWEFSKSMYTSVYYSQRVFCGQVVKRCLNYLKVVGSNPDTDETIFD